MEHVLTRNLSVFLDLLRLLAALLVLLGHAGEVYGMGLPAIVGHSAKEGVAVFFVLSGFVIAFVAQSRERDWQAFARARALRMYSVVPLAIVVMAVCHGVGSSLHPQAYAAGSANLNAGAMGAPPGWWPILRYLTFTNEIWFDRAMISTGAPFWSLGYEAAYYVGFALIFYVRAGWRWIFPVLWLLVCGPRIALAFPLWLIGVATWALVRRGCRLPALWGAAALLAIALAAAALRKWCAFAAMPLFEWGEPAVLAASMGYYLVLAMLLAMAIVVFAACVPSRTIWPHWLERCARFCAGASFTLYIMHLPVMVLIAVAWPGSRGSLAGGLVAATMTVALMFGLAELGERRKAVYTRIFSMSSKSMRIKTKNYINVID